MLAHKLAYEDWIHKNNESLWTTNREAIATTQIFFGLFSLSLIYIKGGVLMVGLLEFNRGVHGENEE